MYILAVMINRNSEQTFHPIFVSFSSKSGLEKNTQKRKCLIPGIVEQEQPTFKKLNAPKHFLHKKITSTKIK